MEVENKAKQTQKTEKHSKKDLLIFSKELELLMGTVRKVALNQRAKHN